MKDDNILWPCDLSAAVKTALLKSAQEYVLDSDETLVTDTGRVNGLYYVMQGLVIASIQNLSKPCPLIMIKAGDWSGGTLISGEDREFPFRITSIEYSKIIFFPEQVIIDLLDSHPELYKFLYLITKERTRESLNLYFASSGMNLIQKVAYFLLEISKAFPRIAGAKPMIPMSQSMLAQILGLSRLSLNQQLHQLEQKKIIAVERKKIHIIDMPALGALVSSTE